MHDRLIISVLSAVTLSILVYFGYLALNPRLERPVPDKLSHQQAVAMQQGILQQPPSNRTEKTNLDPAVKKDPANKSTSAKKPVDTGGTAENQDRDEYAAAAQLTASGTQRTGSRNRPSTSRREIGVENSDAPLSYNATLTDYQRNLDIKAHVDGNIVDFEVTDKNGQNRLRQPGVNIVGPARFRTQSDSLSFNMNKRLADGEYKYEVVADLPEPGSSGPSRFNNGRAASMKPGPARGVVATGSFYVANGVSVDPNLTENDYDTQVQ